MIRNARSRIPRTGVSRIAFAGDTGSASDARSRERQERHDQERAAEEDRAAKVMEQQEMERQQQEKEAGIQEENVRRQERHEEDLRKSQETSELQQKTAGREEKFQGRQEAYEQAKQGLMMGDKEMVQDAMRKLMPEGQTDEITYDKTEEGVRKVTARPGKKDMPEFVFHPDGYVGVQLPGRTKPVVFENAEEAFKTILAPMNPQRYQQKKGATEKDLVAERKNIRTADYQERKLRADIHADAHEAAMQQFERDGYYQAATYDEAAYRKVYDNFVEQASGLTARESAGAHRAGKKGTPDQYRGEKPPKGVKGARKESDGTWSGIDPADGKRKRILGNPGPAAPPKKARPPGEGRPKRSPMPTAEDQPDVQAAGVTFRGASSGQGRGFSGAGNPPKSKNKGKIYRGKAQPPDYPDAQWDEKERAWYYFDGDNERWKKVRA